MKKILYLVLSFFMVLGLFSCGEKTPVTYNVNFESLGGTEVADVVVNAGESVAPPIDPVKDGYTFKGWYTDEACTQKWVFAAKVNSELTLYAKWEEITYNYTKITVKEALDICAGLADGATSSERYLIEATVVSIMNPAYGQMMITDGTGEIEVYGSYGADGVKRYSELEDKPYANDKVKLACLLQNYKGKAEVSSGWILSFEHVEVEINEEDYVEMSIEAARNEEKGAKVKVSGVVARITYANGMIPSGFYLVDGTNSIYVYDSQITSRVAIGNKVTVLGERDQWILADEEANASKFGYKGCTQITNCVLKENDEKTDNEFDKSWIEETTVKAIMETPVSTDITTTIFKVNALVKKAPGTGFINYYINDLDGFTGSYVYTQCNGNDLSWLEPFDGKICTVYLSALNAKSTASGCVWRFIPVAVVDENYKFDLNDAPKIAAEYYGAPQFEDSYTGNPELELITSVSSELLGFENVSLSYTSSNEDVLYFENVDGKVVMNCKGAGAVTVTIKASYNNVDYNFDVEITVLDAPDYEYISIAEAIASPVGEVVTVKGIVAGGIANKVGFYLIDETGTIAVTTDAETIKLIKLGQEVVMRGTRTQFKAENGKLGHTCLLDSTLVVNLYGEHEYSTETFIKDLSLSEIKALPASETLTTQVYVLECSIKVVDSTHYSNIYVAVGDVELLLYCGNSGQYSWLKEFAGQTVTVELALCDWNAKGYKGAVISATGEDGVKVHNNYNFSN